MSARAEMTFPSVVRDLLILAPSYKTDRSQTDFKTRHSSTKTDPNGIWHLFTNIILKNVKC